MTAIELNTARVGYAPLAKTENAKNLITRPALLQNMQDVKTLPPPSDPAVANMSEVLATLEKIMLQLVSLIRTLAEGMPKGSNSDKASAGSPSSDGAGITSTASSTLSPTASSSDPVEEQPAVSPDQSSSEKAAIANKETLKPSLPPQANATCSCRSPTALGSEEAQRLGDSVKETAQSIETAIESLGKAAGSTKKLTDALKDFVFGLATKVYKGFKGIGSLAGKGAESLVKKFTGN